MTIISSAVRKHSPCYKGSGLMTKNKLNKNKCMMIFVRLQLFFVPFLSGEKHHISYISQKLKNIIITTRCVYGPMKSVMSARTYCSSSLQCSKWKLINIWYLAFVVEVSNSSWVVWVKMQQNIVLLSHFLNIMTVMKCLFHFTSLIILWKIISAKNMDE